MKTDPNMTLRHAVQTKYKLPTMHWVALKPNDTKDTIWYIMDDVKLMKDLDFSSFEEEFKLNPVPLGPQTGKKMSEMNNQVDSGPPKPQLDTLMERSYLT